MDITPRQVCVDIFDLLDRVKRSLSELVEYQGITRMQMVGLFVLDRQPDIGMSQMAELLHCDASNVTGIVNRLVAHDLVVREARPDDRRARRLQVTEKGRQILNHAMSDLTSQLGCDKLNAQECQTLHALVQKIGF